MKQLPNKISTEELLKALEGKENEQATAIQESLVYKNNVPLFLSKYNIGPGETKVTKKLLYMLYCKFSTETVSRYEFSATLDLFLIPHGVHIGISNPRDEIIRLLNNKKGSWVKYSPSHPGTRLHYEEFMEAVGLKAGTKWVDSFVLLAIYVKWCRANRKSIRFKPKTFVSMTNLYLEQKRTTYINNWFKVDETVLNYLTTEEKEKIKNDKRNKRIEAAKEKKKQKRQSLLSS